MTADARADNQGVAAIRIVHEKKPHSQMAEIAIAVDGRDVGRLRRGQEIVLPVRPGVRALVAKHSLWQSETVELDVAEGDQVGCACGFCDYVHPLHDKAVRKALGLLIPAGLLCVIPALVPQLADDFVWGWLGALAIGAIGMILTLGRLLSRTPGKVVYLRVGAVAVSKDG